ncbi:Rv3654c family TadE-like protein [Gordonia sp. NPDC003585]|uniref:Rv3654c family TadE-like protein n=1 Tax=unclassified Gordonia (in: high G+C Gram-positive bacteria) TaxID=2657482 RepID=UPI0033AABECF
MNRFLADDRGNATILAAFAIAALTSIIVLVLYLGAAVVARHRAQSAADLAALAAAIAHAGADGEPCAAARDLASAQRPPAVLAECRLDGDDVVVRARIPVELGGLGIRDATAQARAGPV